MKGKRRKENADRKLMSRKKIDKRKMRVRVRVRGV
jgi:hypothetical protein